MDVEKTMAFILAQQAEFAASQARFDERLEKLAAVQDNQQKSIFDLIQVVRALATHATETDHKIDSTRGQDRWPHGQHERSHSGSRWPGSPR